MGCVGCKPARWVEVGTKMAGKNTSGSIGHWSPAATSDQPTLALFHSQIKR